MKIENINLRIAYLIVHSQIITTYGSVHIHVIDNDNGTVLFTDKKDLEDFKKFWAKRKKNALINLYSAIKNDYSIQRYSLGWSYIIDRIEKLYKNIKINNTEFNNEVLNEALPFITGTFKSSLEAFAKELSINLQTLHEK